MELKDIFLIKYSNDPLFDVISEYVSKLYTFYSNETYCFKNKFEAILNKYRFSSRQDILKDGIIPHIMLSKEPGSFDITLFFDWDGGIGKIDNKSEILLEDPKIYCTELTEVCEYFEDIHLNYLVSWMAIIWQDVKIDDDSLIVVLSENSTTYTFVFNDLAWDDFSSFRFEYEISKPVKTLPDLDIATIYGRVLRTYPYNKYKYVEHYYSLEEKVIGIAFYRSLLAITEVIDNNVELIELVSFKRTLDLVKHINNLEIEYSLKGFKGIIMQHINHKPLIDDAYNFNVQCNNPDIYGLEKFNNYSDEINHLENEIGVVLPNDYKAFLRIISSYSENTYRVSLREKANGKQETFKFYNIKELQNLSNLVQSKNWMIIGYMYSGGYICLNIKDTKTLKLFSESNSKGVCITTQLEEIWKTHLIY